MSMHRPDPRWGEVQRAWLGIAIDKAGHGQKGCAQELAALGVRRVSQGLVSRWASGAIKTPGCIDDLLTYCERHEPDAPTHVARTTALDATTTESEPVRHGWESARRLATELEQTRKELQEERAQSLQVARDIERMAKQLALILEGS